MPYFNAKLLPPPSAEYVLWLDVMGIQSAMSRSISIAANFVFKLHAMALEAPNDGIALYPVMDGLYAATPSRVKIESFAGSILREASDLFVAEPTPLFRFIVKGAVAYGLVVHGASVPQDACPILASRPTYKENLLVGLPMVQAHQGEREAPPFGLYTHESARAFAAAGAEPFHQTWWRWSPYGFTERRETLRLRLIEHYTWCETHSHSVLYEPERIRTHRAMAIEYLSESY
jgi:hypothetical protein